MASEDADEENMDLFQEPADFFQPEKEATFASHHLLSGQELAVRLVGHNPLWVRPNHRPLRTLQGEKRSHFFLTLASSMICLFSPKLFISFDILTITQDECVHLIIFTDLLRVIIFGTLDGPPQSISNHVVRNLSRIRQC